MAGVIGEDQFWDNEMDFCRITGQERLERAERALLQGGISYFVKWEGQPLLERLFHPGLPKTVVLRINMRDYDRAAELIGGMDGVRMIGEEPAEDWSPAAELRKRQEGRFRVQEEQNEDGEDDGRDAGEPDPENFR